MIRENQPTLATLEVPSDPGLDYTQYWQDFRQARGLIDSDDIIKTCRLGSYLTCLTREVVQGNDLSETILMPDMQTGAPQAPTISNAIAEWDRTTGSRNSLQGAQGDLLRAAGLLLQTNFSGGLEEFGLPATDSDETYTRFMSLVENNDLEQQLPGSDLLLAGQLVHKAAWTEEDPVRQEALFKTAINMYDRIHDNPDAVWINRLMAGQYRSDIYFHWLHQDMRVAIKYQDREDETNLRGIAVELLREMAVDLQQAGRLADQADDSDEATGGLQGFEWAGFMLESFALIAVRDMLYVRSKPSVAARYEVRRAFQHEDQPRNLKLQPKQSFDIVVQRWGTDGKIAETTPIQLKLRSMRKPRYGDKDSDYKGIPCIGVNHLGTSKMVWTVDNLLVSYAEQEFHRGSGPLSRVQDLFSAVVDNRLVSAPR